MRRATSLRGRDKVPVIQNVIPDNPPSSAATGCSSVTSSKSANSRTIGSLSASPESNRSATVAPTPSIAINDLTARLCLCGLPASSSPGSSPLISTSSSSASSVSTSAATTEAISGPMRGRPSAERNFDRGMLLLPSISASTFEADFSAIRSSPSNCWRSSE